MPWSRKREFIYLQTIRVDGENRLRAIFTHFHVSSLVIATPTRRSSSCLASTDLDRFALGSCNVEKESCIAFGVIAEN